MALVIKNKISSYTKENRVLIYQKEKKIRGSHYSIYSDGTIEIRGKLLSSTKFTIPKDLFQWFEISNPSRIFYVEIKLFPINTYSADIKARFLCEKYGTFIQFLEQLDLKIGEQVLFKLDFRNSNIKPTPKFHKTLALLELHSLPSIETLTYLFTGGKGNREFSLYKDNRNVLFVKANGTLRDGGSVSLSQELGYYIEDWFEKDHLVYASKDKEEAKIIESRIIRKNTTRHLEKCIYFPYQGKSKPISFVISSHEFQLTRDAIQDFDIKQSLTEKGISISRFKSHSLLIGNHCDYKFEAKIRKIAHQFSSNYDWFNSPEVYLEFNNQNYTIQGNFKTVDNIITERNLLKILLMEIKTSDKNLGSELEYAIASILHTKSMFNRDYVFPILFINQDTKRLNGSLIITENFGFSCGIILIGPEKASSLQESPQKLLSILNDYTEKMNILSKERSKLIHPISGNITTNILLQKEAYQLLANSKLSENKIIPIYCLLMGITLTDFWLLYRYFRESINNCQMQNQSDFGILQDVEKKSPNLAIFDYLHNLLVEKGYFALLALKSKLPQNEDLHILLQNQDLILERFPACIKIRDIWKRKRGKGTAYEHEIRKKLIKNGYQVASNVMLSNLSKPFEVDHLAFKNNAITLVSCKDRRNISYEPDLPHLIREAANVLEFRKNLLNIDTAILYVKVNPNFFHNQQLLFGQKPWVKNVEIIIE